MLWSRCCVGISTLRRLATTPTRCWISGRGRGFGRSRVCDTILVLTATELTCGTVGDLFPSSNILGVDLSPIQPEWVPPNVRFMVDDIEYVVLAHQEDGRKMLTHV